MSPYTGRPAVHGQTLAYYRLVRELRERFPHLAIENCSSGGGRVDLAISEVTDSVWSSDCTDPVERVDIQRF
ncbi:alpha-galactosidase [Arcanobacterium haemolyticum]|uniref:alpha-galactosidase n=1 Tax=Arcanobacterium haemolyticum TaxID=28264 RepID=UPI000317D3CF